MQLYGVPKKKNIPCPLATAMAILLVKIRFLMIQITGVDLDNDTDDDDNDGTTFTCICLCSCSGIIALCHLQPPALSFDNTRKALVKKEIQNVKKGFLNTLKPRALI